MKGKYCKEKGSSRNAIVLYSYYSSQLADSVTTLFVVVVVSLHQDGVKMKAIRSP